MKSKSLHQFLLFVLSISLALFYQNCADKQGGPNYLGGDGPIPGNNEGSGVASCNFNVKSSFAANEAVTIDFSVSSSYFLEVKVFKDNEEKHTETVFGNGTISPNVSASTSGAGSYDVFGYIRAPGDPVGGIPRGSCNDVFEIKSAGTQPTTPTCSLSVSPSEIQVGSSVTLKVKSATEGLTAKVKIAKKSGSSSNNLALTEIGTTTNSSSTTANKIHKFSHANYGDYTATGYIVVNGQDKACSETKTITLQEPADTQVTDLKISTPYCSVTTPGANCTNNFTYKVPTLAPDKRIIFLRKRPKSSGGFNYYKLGTPEFVEKVKTSTQTGKVPLFSDTDTSVVAYEISSSASIPAANSSVTPTASAIRGESNAAQAGYTAPTGPSATIVANPNPCSIPASGTNCSTVLTTTVSQRPTNTYICIWAKQNSTGAYTTSWVDCQKKDSFTTTNINWVTTSGHTFEAYVAGTTDASRNTRSGNPIGSISVSGTKQPAALSVAMTHSHTSCQNCTVTTSYSISNLPSGKVVRIYRKTGTLAPTSVKCVSSNSSSTISTTVLGTSLFQAYEVATCSSSITGLNPTYTSSSFTITTSGGGGGGPPGGGDCGGQAACQEH